MSILAVGDDDQNIYTFRGANVGFIRKFEEDYSSGKKEDLTSYLVENYRSTRYIIEVSNRLIQKNRDRMKTNYPIRIDPTKGIATSRWYLDHTRSYCPGTGPIVANRPSIAPRRSNHRRITANEKLQPDLQWRDIAILSRTKENAGRYTCFL